MNRRAIWFYGAAVVFFALALWAAWPSRNAHGNPSLEHLLAQCRTSSGTSVRLYEGNGGATTDFWYTVTVTSTTLGAERQVLFVDGSPVLRGLACNTAGVQIETASTAIAIAETEFAALRGQPRAIWRGKERDIGTNPLIQMQRNLAALCAVAAIASLFLARRSSRQ